ncbi:MAG: molybdopterin molybdotransferase MoeA [Beijerinckiaceae bacterium]|nr:molybdopterin molybdotransferase MoeA [Beijerinckiaceae bacterium]MCZ8299787.1 molybdopterin molybdotransferase MoeA [Beijerinckiaceae bacterium]
MAGLLPVEDALALLVAAGAAHPRRQEMVPVQQASGRVLAADLTALRTQPPAAMSAMDGFALRASDGAAPGASLRIIGESAAGHPFAGTIGTGEAIRIYTGAILPAGADCVVMQENATAEGAELRLTVAAQVGRHVRPSGCDFHEGQTLLSAGTRLTPGHIALAGAMNHAEIPVFARPRIGVLATGDELVLPGAPRAPHQIVATNAFAAMAMMRPMEVDIVDLGIAADSPEALNGAIDRALAEAVDCLVTIGGASVGKHDLVRPVAAARGAELAFYKIAMRPGKPLNFGRLGPMLLLGLPGNPVSALVCTRLFLLPLIAAMQGDASAGQDRSEAAILGAAFPANDERQDYVRVMLERDARGLWIARPAGGQDSSFLSVLARADGLLIRPPHAPAGQPGDPARVLRLG